MEAQQLDDLAREIGSQLPRRSVLGALGGLAALLAAPALEGDAKKKKRKKKCKGNKKKCGKKCISPDKCCTTADCGKRGECVGGACVCPAGKKSCNGGCIANDACCQNSDCGATQTCTNGTCTCPGNLTKCGPDCIESGLCCPNGDCPAGQTCEGATCWCDAADGIWCDAECCDAGNDETCARSEAGSACAGGGCQLFDWCNVVSDSVCRDTLDAYCVCITSYGPTEEVPACVDGLAIGESCETCETNDECGAGFVCVQGDTGESEICGCPGKFCARLCDAEPEREPRRASASARNAGHMAKARRSR
ncbi:MAG: hypothetical protein M3Z20_01840 [Chloroflexota bacterium]|nr:hypothetical protein [Chloroflexota bacterium]